MTTAGKYGPLVPHIRPCAPRQCKVWIGNNPPNKRIQFWGLLRVCMALKTLQCCGNSSLSEQRSTLRAIITLKPPKITSASLGGCNLFIQSIGVERKASCGVLEGHCCLRQPWLWRLWCQLCFVIRLLKSSINILKLVVCNQYLYVLLYCKTYYNSRIANCSVDRAWVVCGQSPNYFGPMDPGILGIAGKLLSLWELFSHCFEAKT